MDEALLEPLEAPAVAGCLTPDFSADLPAEPESLDDFSADDAPSDLPFEEVEADDFFASARLSVR